MEKSTTIETKEETLKAKEIIEKKFIPKRSTAKGKEFLELLKKKEQGGTDE